MCEEKLESEDGVLKIGAIVGLGIAYAGSEREDILEILGSLILDENYNIDINALAALNLGLIFVGSCNEDVVESIIETLSLKTKE